MEKWIWTELLAFDRTEVDRGVGHYLETLGFVPDGISLLLSAIDFVVLHTDWEPERVLFPDVCSRLGHGGNEERKRQEWRCGELRELVAGLQQQRIKVFFSLFPYYLGDRFHDEFATRHPECRVVSTRCGLTDGISLISRLDDGELFDDLFAARLTQVFADYGFDGFHGADGMGPGGLTLATNDYSPNFLAQFREYLGVTADLWPTPGLDPVKLTETAQHIWRRFWPEWCDFNALRWRQCWTKIVAAARSLGRQTMLNSPNTKGLFDGLFQYGIDYRQLEVDYLLVETVAPGFRILDGGHEFQLEFAAQLQEFAAALPQTRILFLHGVKDVVESYDLLRHAPSWLEGDFFLQNHLFVLRNGAWKTAADGFMVCLGDGLDAGEWQQLRQLWRDHAAIQPVTEAGELLWLWQRREPDGLRRSYPVSGDWPGYQLIAGLGRQPGCLAQGIAELDELGENRLPLVVPHAELLAPEELTRLLERPEPLVLLGRPEAVCDREPDGWISCSNCAMTAWFFHTGGSFPGETVDSDATPFVARIPEFNYTVLPDYMKIPEEFFRRCAARLRQLTGADCRLNGAAALLCRSCGNGRNYFGVLSQAAGYLTLVKSAFAVGRQLELAVGTRFRGVRKISKFPHTALALENERLVSPCGTPVNLPPYGVLILELSAEAENIRSSHVECSDCIHQIERGK